MSEKKSEQFDFDKCSRRAFERNVSKKSFGFCRLKALKKSCLKLQGEIAQRLTITKSLFYCLDFESFLRIFINNVKMERAVSLPVSNGNFQKSKFVCKIKDF